MEDIYEIYLLRATYEQVAVRTYEGQLSDEDLAQMESIVEEMKIFGEDDLGDLVDCDCRFHQVIVEKAGLNRLLKASDRIELRQYCLLFCRKFGTGRKRQTGSMIFMNDF